MARLVRARCRALLLLATEHPADPGARVDLGLDRLRHADLPSPAAPARQTADSGGRARRGPRGDEAPLHLLRRRVHQAVSGGRRVLAFPGGATVDGAAAARRTGDRG